MKILKRKDEVDLSDPKLQSNLKNEEREMISGIISLDDTTIKEKMVPRIDAVFLNTTMSYNEVMKTVLETGFSRYPVYQDKIDTIIGILHLKDLLKNIYLKNDFNLAKIVRSALFVPESKKLDGLLKDFLSKHVHIAIAIDEYGGVAGLICMEDVMESIVGDIQDEFDNEDSDFVKISSTEVICDARVMIEEIEEYFNVDLPKENIESIGGFVFNLIGTVPELEQSIQFDKLFFKVAELQGNAIKKIKITQI